MEHMDIIVTLFRFQRLTLCVKKPTTILYPTHDHVLIQGEPREEGLLTDGLASVCCPERARANQSVSRSSTIKTMLVVVERYSSCMLLICD